MAVRRICKYAFLFLFAVVMLISSSTYAAADSATYVKEEILNGAVKVRYNEPVKRVKETLSTPARREPREYDVDIWTRDTKIYIERGYHHKYKKLNINFMIKDKAGNLKPASNSIPLRNAVTREVKDNRAAAGTTELIDILTSPEDYIFYDWSGNKYTETSPDLYLVIDIEYIPEGSEEIIYIPKFVKFDIKENDKRKIVKSAEDIDGLTLRKNVLRGNMETYNPVRVEKEYIKYEMTRRNIGSTVFVDGEYEVEIWDENTFLECIYSNHDNYKKVESGFFVKKDGLLYQMLGIEEGGFEKGDSKSKSIYDGHISIDSYRKPQKLKGYIYDFMSPESFNKKRGADKKAYTLENSEIYGYVKFYFEHEDPEKNKNTTANENFKLFKFISSGADAVQKEDAAGGVPAVLKQEITTDYVAQLIGHSYEDGVLVVQLKEQGKYGVIDRSGKITYDVGNMVAYKEGLARIIKNNLCGFIDSTGRAIVPPIYEHAEDFSDGLALIKKDGLYGYIDKTGKEVIPPRYTEASSFSEGLASFMTKDYKFGFIDKTGREVIAPRYSNAGPFSEGMAPVMNIKHLWGYIDKAGREVVAPKYNEVGRFVEGHAWVEIGRLFGYIDKTGHEVIPPKYGSAFDLSDGIGLMWDTNGLRGYVDKTGREIVPPKYNFALPFSEGIGKFQSLENHLQGYVDNTGREIVPPKYKHANDFSDGMAAVSADGLRWGYIDKTGREVLPQQYRFARDFKGGYAAVKIEKGLYSYFGLINKKGEVVIPAEYDDIVHVSGNTVFALKNNRVEVFHITLDSK